METRDISTINFIDQDSGDEAVAVVRTTNGAIAVALSISSGSDVEVVMKPRDCERLLLALREAVAVTTVPR